MNWLATKRKTRMTIRVIRTTFVNGDAIGLYITDGNGNIVVSNQKVTCEKNSTWHVGNNSSEAQTTIKYHPHYHYFTYYPYSNTAPAETELTKDATTAEEFFGTYISKWTPSADQSTAEKYHAQDLMVATGEAGRDISFPMAHQMALVEFDFAQVCYWKCTGNATGITADKYQFDYYTPLNIADGQYRILVSPTQSICFSGKIYADIDDKNPQTWSIPAEKHAKATLKKYKNAAPSLLNYAPAVGSYYYLTPNGNGLCCNRYDKSLGTPVGLIISTTSTDYETSAYNHGFVMALADASQSSTWNHASAAAIQYMSNRPEDSSGWRMPNHQELYLINNTLKDLNLTTYGLYKSGHTYWTNESFMYMHYCANFNSNGCVEKAGDTTSGVSYRVRYVLTF